MLLNIMFDWVTQKHKLILPRIDTDLLDIFIKILKTKVFSKFELKISQLNAATVIMSSGGYPEKYSKGHIVAGCNDINDSIIFHAGLKLENG